MRIRHRPVTTFSGLLEGYETLLSDEALHAKRAEELRQRRQELRCQLERLRQVGKARAGVNPLTYFILQACTLEELDMLADQVEAAQALIDRLDQQASRAVLVVATRGINDWSALWLVERSAEPCQIGSNTLLVPCRRAWSAEAKQGSVEDPVLCSNVVLGPYQVRRYSESRSPRRIQECGTTNLDAGPGTWVAVGSRAIKAMLARTVCAQQTSEKFLKQCLGR